MDRITYSLNEVTMLLGTTYIESDAVVSLLLSLRVNGGWLVPHSQSQRDFTTYSGGGLSATGKTADKKTLEANVIAPRLAAMIMWLSAGKVYTIHCTLLR